MNSTHSQPLKHLKTEWLIKDAIANQCTVSTSFEEAKKEFTCDGCAEVDACQFAWDIYNLHGDCLAIK